MVECYVLQFALRVEIDMIERVLKKSRSCLPVFMRQNG